MPRIVGAWRIRAVLAEDNVALQPYDQNAWATAFRYAETPAADSVATFRPCGRGRSGCFGASIPRATSMRDCMPSGAARASRT